MKIFNHVCPWGKWPTKSARPTGKSTSPRQLDTGFVEPCSDVRVSNLPACAFRARFWPPCVRVSCTFLTFLRARFVRISDLPACAFRARFWPSCVRVSCAFLTILRARFVRVSDHPACPFCARFSACVFLTFLLASSSAFLLASSSARRASSRARALARATCFCSSSTRRLSFSSSSFLRASSSAYVDRNKPSVI